MKDLLTKIESEIAKADKALSLVPKDEYLKLRAAFAKLKRLTIAKEVYLELTGKKFDG